MRTFEACMLAYATNSVWQVALLAPVAWVMARGMRPFGPHIPHRVWVCAVLLASALPACSWPAWARAFGGWPWAVAPARGALVSVTIGDGVAGGNATRWMHAAQDAGMAVWTALGLYFTARLLWRLYVLARLRRSVQPVVWSTALERCWAECGLRFNLCGALLVQSDEVLSPVSLGWRRVLLVLPVGMAQAMDEEEIAAVLAHESAHIARRDFAKNLLYEVVSLPVAWHPLLWFSRERLAETREMICDHLGAEMLGAEMLGAEMLGADLPGARERFAKTLLRLALLLSQGKPARFSHAIGIFDANTLERRIEMLTDKRTEVRGVRRLAAAAVCIVVGLAACASALALRIGVQADSAQATPVQATGRTVKVSGGVMQGLVLTKAVPKYPQEAKDAKISGAVVLSAVIDKAGLVQDLQVVAGPEKLRQSALDAVKQWTYKPYLLNGDPTAVQTTITVTYSLVN